MTVERIYKVDFGLKAQTGSLLINLSLFVAKITDLSKSYLKLKEKISKQIRLFF
jgi:hypothetical protein